MSIENIPVGNVARIEGKFRNEDGDLTDPDAVVLTVLDPAGTETTFTWADTDVEQIETGWFRYDLSLDQSGDWRWKMVGTGAIDAERTGVVNAFDHYASP